ncbi:ABC transporter substrate-binding protein [Tropicimonas isoalkanivorans]|uniref:Putative spermidine/putrescine transport system substrate-binding protein n=1 Tax=Tropicimonas isoalkanivorans TaxID=441112 RepID=A0A1I1HTV7_9RHOB|nr:ABC transporter substrate-binding protein [Tropicimonas isoalkanivorans]SFC27012.1 putative spermidine/putrescine transport system substrate-binding protein [Tropicimonas isoalkanivorans]
MTINRRQFAKLAAGASLTALASAQMAGAQGKPPRITYNGAGGSQEQAVKTAYLDKFTADTGIEVVTSSPTDFGKLKAMVDSNAVIWDLAEIGGQDIVRASRMNLLEPIDENVVDRSEFVDQAIFEKAMSAFVYSTVIGYNTETFEDAPEGWQDFWDFEKFPGQRAMRNHPTVNLEAALLADGVAPEDLYPLDLDRAFAKLEEIAPQTIWWTAGAQPPQLLVDGEVALAVGWNGRFYNLIKEGAPLAIAWDGGALMPGGVGIPKGAPNAAEAQQVLSYMANPENQAIFCSSQTYSGTHKRAGEFVDAELQPFLPLYPDNAENQWWVDLEYWLDHGDEITERWNKWILAQQG